MSESRHTLAITDGELSERSGAPFCFWCGPDLCETRSREMPPSTGARMVPWPRRRRGAAFAQDGQPGRELRS
jgi:hypothetical protein